MEGRYPLTGLEKLFRDIELTKNNGLGRLLAIKALEINGKSLPEKDIVQHIA